MAGEVDPNNILFTLLVGIPSKGKELPLQNINGVRNDLAAEVCIPRKILDPLLVKCGLLKRKNAKEFTVIQPNRDGIEAFWDDTSDLTISINWFARPEDKKIRYQRSQQSK